MRDQFVIGNQAQIQAVAFLVNRIAAETVPTLVLNRVPIGCPVGGHEIIEVIFLEWVAHPKAGHVGAQIVKPDFLSIAFVRITAGEEKYIGLYSLSIKNACRQAQNGM